jgi:soluble lytic murein transglycosylase
MRTKNRAATGVLAAMLVSVSCAVAPATPEMSERGAHRDRRVDVSRVRIASEIRAWESGLTPAAIDQLVAVILREARAAGLAPELVLAVIEIESGGRTDAVSPAGAVGLMQLLPTTGAFVARSAGLPWRGPEALFDPALNVRLGVRYLERLMRRYPDLRIALAAYNWGPGHISGRLRRGEPLPRRYADRVLAALAGDGREI